MIHFRVVCLQKKRCVWPSPTTILLYLQLTVSVERL